MKLTELLLAELNREVERSRRVLQETPAGHYDWKPHEKSMPFGRLAMLVARMPSWLPLILNKDELDLNPKGGSNVDQRPLGTSAELVQAHDEGVAQARTALTAATDTHLMTTKWRLLVSGQIVSEELRHIVVRDTFMHLSHHRGQLTVYLRLNGIAVPAIYGPSADEARFA